MEEREFWRVVIRKVRTKKTGLQVLSIALSVLESEGAKKALEVVDRVLEEKSSDMNEKQKIEIDQDLYGIGWRFDEPWSSDVGAVDFETFRSDGEHNSVGHARDWMPSWKDVAWRNAATIEEDRRKRRSADIDPEVLVDPNLETIEWRYDAPSKEEQSIWGFVAQRDTGLPSVCWLETESVRWTILSKPTKRKMTIKQFCAKWDLKIHGDRCFNGHVMITLDNELGTFLQIGRGFKGDVLELFNDYREVWG